VAITVANVAHVDRHKNDLRDLNLKWFDMQLTHWIAVTGHRFHLQRDDTT
jgi:hypothetical protein